MEVRENCGAIGDPDGSCGSSAGCERDDLRGALKQVRMALKNGGDLSVRRIELMLAVIDEALGAGNA